MGLWWHRGSVMNRFTVALIHNNTDGLPGWVPERLEAAGVALRQRQCASPAEVIESAADAEVLWDCSGTRAVTPQALERLPRCGALLRSGSGTDNLPVEAATRLGIVVANTPDAIADPVADHTVALLLAVERRLGFYDQSVRRGEWLQLDKARWPVAPVRGRTLGLIGFGAIAQAVARKLSGFELQVLACDPALTAEQVAARGARKVELEELLRAADFVSVHCPLTPQTRHLLNRQRLGLLKPTAIIVNTARGPVVDEVALIEALQAGRLAGAGLDVFEQEPLPAEHPLRMLANVILTPHLAGHTRQIWDDFYRLSAETILDLARGRWPRSVVNRRAGVRWRLELAE